MTDYLFPAVFGLIFGSFVNVLILRLPEDMSIIRPASQCVHCQKPLKWWMNIPVFSYLFLKGKCYYCSTKISALYPFIEAACALLWIVFFDVNEPLSSTGLCLGLCFLVAVGTIDYQHLIIHNVLLAAAFVCFLAAVVSGSFLWQYHLLGLVFCPAFIFMVSRTVKLVNKRDNLGGGDIFLGFVVGFLLGPYKAFLMYFAASLAGILFWLFKSGYKTAAENPLPIPFGTGMVLGTIIIELLFLPSTIEFVPSLEIFAFTDDFVRELVSGNNGIIN